MIFIIITVLSGILITRTAISRLPGNRFVTGKFLLLYPAVMTLLFELPWDDPIYLIKKSIYHHILNYLISALIMLIFILLFYKVQHGIYAALIFAATFGVANAEVIEFRFYPIEPVDILSVRTAAAVAGGYSLVFNLKIFLTFFIMFAAIIFAGLQKEYFKRINLTIREKKNLRSVKYPLAALLIILFSVFIYKVDLYSAFKVSYYEWEPVQTYKECGLPLTFTSEIHTMFKEIPKGYSKKKALEVINLHQEDIDDIEVSGSPVVLVIMNESFTDYQMVGKLDKNDEYLSFLHSLKDDHGTKEYGYTYTSTYGGGTYKSEFEYLTGNSMANISGTIPYMMFDFSKVEGLVKSYNDEGFRTVASHPFFKTDWRRDKVYDGMGFDTFLWLSDFDTEGKDDPRGYISDEGNYERLLEEIENTKEPLFLFNVTMQNHGGYNMSELSDVAVDVDSEYNSYDDFRIFAGDMKKSDEALSFLVSALKDTDRPVTLVLFGDHQPSLDSECLDILFKSKEDTARSESEYDQRRYITPYFIWTNGKGETRDDYNAPTFYDTDINIITPTYLGVMTRYYAGCDLTDFDKYMLYLRKELPILNVNGIYREDTGFVPQTELDSVNSDIKELLSDYSFVEYKRIYD